MTDAVQEEPAWQSALSPHLVEMVRVPLTTPLRTRAGELIPEVRGAVMRFPRWTGPAFQDDFGKKSSAFVEIEGEHLFAELAVLRLLEREGWEGRWVTTYGRAHGEVWKLLTRWLDAPRDDQKHVPIEDTRARQLLASIAAINKPARYAGCWGTYAWRGGDFAFFDCKRTSSTTKERVKVPQEEWLRMALAAHPAVFDVDSFCFVLWDYI